jgi:hypothetical protein
MNYKNKKEKNLYRYRSFVRISPEKNKCSKFSKLIQGHEKRKKEDLTSSFF